MPRARPAKRPTSGSLPFLARRPGAGVARRSAVHQNPSVHREQNAERARRAVLRPLERLEDRNLPSLLVAYDFSEAGGTTVFDASGNGTSGTISGATRTAAGKYGSALSFNGASSWVT